MIYPKIPLAQSLIEIFRQKNITQIVISPGSRNAPLTIGFVNNPAFTCYSIADERCAAFFALGIAQQTQKPVALVCTSGSALLNYYPAIAEAFYSQIPLIVVSADRPKDKIDIGDGQTIRQENVFANHSVFNANLSEFQSEENHQKIVDAIENSISKKAPVHINIPFEEPLYETVNKLSQEIKVAENNPISETTYFKIEDKFVEIWNASTKKMIVVGELFPNSISDEITTKIATDDSVLVLTEKQSNWHHESFLDNIDSVITPFSEDEANDFSPEILITFGGMIVSKRIKALLRKHKPKHHWHIDSLRAYDTFDCLSHHFEVEPEIFFQNFLSNTKSTNSDYALKYNLLNKDRNQNHDVYLSKILFSDLKAFEVILESLPENSQLQLGNSSTIRHAQLFDIHPSIEVFSNRGTSGIDGCTSTAIGAAVANSKPTTFISGDISFFYDSNALWNNYIPKNFKIIVINNGGGGIFRILPGHEENQVFNTFFETEHCLTTEHLAKMYNLDYFKASNEQNLSENIKKLQQSENPAILEVFTPTKINDEILLNYFKEL